jgi:hypothetical protein
MKMPTRCVYSDKLNEREKDDCFTEVRYTLKASKLYI